jgi:hypothetical protein
MYQINKGRRTQAAQEPVIFKYSNFKRSALYLGVIFAGTVFAACHSAPVHRGGSGVANTTQALAPGQQKTPLDSVIQFLVWSSAADFNAHRPPDPVNFRNVRLGHVVTPGGGKQFMLCGEFLSERKGSEPEWLPFATIKTSGYEQWIGARADGFCHNPSVTWDEAGDLSSMLQNRMDSLR